MVDRQDIDALLISALYGELTPADEARLTAHLESHPADRSALEGLTQTRTTVRESRILTFQTDPPQSISALLLQEAARRAPRRVVAKDDNEVGWFQRFVRSFMAHPAMAAAAMIIVVVGFAGILQSRKGDHFAESTVDSRASVEERAPAAAGSSASITHDGSGADGYNALSNEQGTLEERQEKRDQGVATGAADRDSFRVDLAPETKPSAPSPKKGRPSGIEVQTPGPAPKELADAKAKQEPTKVAPKLAKPSITKQPTADDSELAYGGDSPAPPPPAQNAPGLVGGAAGPNRNAPVVATPPQNDKSVARSVTSEKEKAIEPTLLAWAKDKHARASKLATAGNCREAATVVSEIATRAPDYYNQSVAADRALKQCIQYINDAREKDAERSNKSRAQKRVDANEVSPAPSSTK
ncbi:MAG: hypothetical protein H0T79_03825 [Deltaproteobacteria bacterium]|nr:hypothetical protein [Deltaproteobacteria bacterium]